MQNINLQSITVITFIGLGFGINYTGCFAAVNSFFDKYRTIATGSISIGVL